MFALLETQRKMDINLKILIYCHFYIKPFIYSSHMDSSSNKCLHRKFTYDNLPWRVILACTTVAGCHSTVFFTQRLFEFYDSLQFLKKRNASTFILLMCLDLAQKILRARRSQQCRFNFFSRTDGFWKGFWAKEGGQLQDQLCCSDC